ncbi:hypothetical protein FJ958_18985 [Mesorhizobium sp. B2-3-5]|nr:hypothetical protein FJ958_18985 [Mesorhizobium sp. B2-3-5]
MLSSAIADCVAHGASLEVSVREAKQYVFGRLGQESHPAAADCANLDTAALGGTIRQRATKLARWRFRDRAHSRIEY